MAVEDTQPLISHLIELRKRLLNSIICVLAVFVVLVFFANDIYQLVSAPLLKHRRGVTVLYADQADHDRLGVCLRADDSVSGVGIHRAGAVQA